MDEGLVPAGGRHDRRPFEARRDAGPPPPLLAIAAELEKLQAW